ncbi:RHBDD1 [Cordylochernes scorpioides]|uniref:RHBDD1 n=1 Tax=Cordylochernes scorpioides TaxID=51811 RepID=A0ABY6KA64_9ARAC|nr:RHBDD1 [Cordylochernes scorpioides]
MEEEELDEDLWNSVSTTDQLPLEQLMQGTKETENKATSNLGIGMLMFYILVVVGFANIPPFTLVYTCLQFLLDESCISRRDFTQLCSIHLQVLVYLRTVQLPWTSAEDVALSTDAILVRGEWWRLVLSTLEHSSDWDLSYTLGSFVLHGLQMELLLGTPRFMYLVLGIFTPLTSLLYVLMAVLLSKLGDFSPDATVGFSGVMFAVKALSFHHRPYSTAIPRQYAIWAELILLHLVMREPFLLGHLAGIFVGSAYSKGPLRQTLQRYRKKTQFAPTAKMKTKP